LEPISLPTYYNFAEEMKTLTVGLTSFQSYYLNKYDLLMAGATLAIMPVMIVFLSMQRYFVQGITLTGLKR
jgi:multiple sugar transport system permease protein